MARRVIECRINSWLRGCDRVRYICGIENAKARNITKHLKNMIHAAEARDSEADITWELIRDYACEMADVPIEEAPPQQVEISESTK
jgi:hypothetical protein